MTTRISKRRGYDERMLELQYEKHLERMKKVHGLVDHHTPIINLHDFVRIYRIKDDTDTYTELLQDNADLLAHMNKTMRKVGVVKTFTDVPLVKFIPTNIHVMRRRIREINKDNCKLGIRLVKVKGVLHTREPDTEEEIQGRLDKRRAAFVMPEVILTKYKKLDLPDDVDLLRKLFRPKVYMDFEVQNIRPLGRVIIQLYTEASPRVVMEFIRFCESGQADKMHFLRVFPNLWVEAELPFPESSALNRPMEYDMRSLDHTRSDCILSYNKVYVKGFPYGCIHYNISFRKMAVQNGQSVAFGRVFNNEGCSIVNVVQDYGTKNGKLSKGIIITDCGVFY